MSLCVGMLLDKFAVHLPLYRQHQRQADSSITVSRPWPTLLAGQASVLLRLRWPRSAGAASRLGSAAESKSAGQAFEAIDSLCAMEAKIREARLN